jgi:hypothetical protein
MWVSPVFFGPRTPHGKPGQVKRTWGARPVSIGSVYGTGSAEIHL